MRKKLFTAAVAAFAIVSLGGLAVAAANSVGTRPSPAHVSRVDDKAKHPTTKADDKGVDAPAKTATTVDDKGVDNPATHDVGDDNGVDNPATHDVGDDNGVDNPATHDVGDDNGVDNPDSTSTTVDDSGTHGSDDSGKHGSDG